LPVTPQPSWVEQIVQLTQRLNEAMQPFLESQRRMSERLAPLLEQLPKQTERWRELAARAQQSIRRAFPPNWLGLETEDIFRAVELMVDFGINVAWVPRQDIILELVSAADATARDVVLIGREAKILHDLDECVDATDHEDVAAPVDALREAIQTFRDGHPRAAQALTAVALGSAIHDVLGHSKFADARKSFEELDPEPPIQEFRLTAVLRCIARALQKTDIAGPGFNRHASAHRISAEQYTRANAIAGLLLVAGLLQELDFWQGRADQDGS
jgi:hypothetical protein